MTRHAIFKLISNNFKGTTYCKAGLKFKLSLNSLFCKLNMGTKIRRLILFRVLGRVSWGNECERLVSG